jgi:hypothetical protein
MTADRQNRFDRSERNPGRVWITAALSLASCAVAVWFLRSGESLKKFGVQGKIVVDGKPLDQAVIVFIPLSIAGAKQSGAEVTNGEYQIEQINGLAKGRYRVEFYPYVSPFAAERGKAMAMPTWYGNRPRLEINVTEEQPKYDFSLKTGGHPVAIKL